MKTLVVAVLLTVAGCSTEPVAVTVTRAGRVLVTNRNVAKVVNQLAELYKAKGISDFAETRRALGGVISDHAGHELHHTFVQQRYHETILDLHRSYTEKHIVAFKRTIDNLAKATSNQKINSHLQEMNGLMKKLAAKAKGRDAVFQQVVPHNSLAINIRSDIDELIRRQRHETIPELQKNLTEAILQSLDKYGDRDRQTTLLIIGEKIHEDLHWLFYK